ncbi:MAG: hypothetical protein P8Y71_27995 [Pseudolabrys sp.]|jgi:hypothetical protein
MGRQLVLLAIAGVVLAFLVSKSLVAPPRMVSKPKGDIALVQGHLIAVPPTIKTIPEASVPLP